MNTNDCPSEARKKGDILVDSLHEERRSAHNNSLSSILCIHLNPSQFVFKHTKTVMISVGLEMINAIMSII